MRGVGVGTELFRSRGSLSLGINVFLRFDRSYLKPGSAPHSAKCEAGAAVTLLCTRGREPRSLVFGPSLWGEYATSFRHHSGT